MKNAAQLEWKDRIITTFFILRYLLYISIPASLFFFYVWQNVSYQQLNREVRKLSAKKEELIKKNDDLKIGIAEYTSAERIEGLYRKTYNYLPISVGSRIVTITLPPEKTFQSLENEKQK
ncbi:MAG: septum formation initiator family protein [Leptospira sp.]|nr:septum formation initiator family protein [Leptospira sp.]